jgi:hypothetical protein
MQPAAPIGGGASHRSGGQDALTAVLVVGSLVMAGLAVRLTGSPLSASASASARH